MAIGSIGQGLTFRIGPDLEDGIPLRFTASAAADAVPGDSTRGHCEFDLLSSSDPGESDPVQAATAPAWEGRWTSQPAFATER